MGDVDLDFLNQSDDYSRKYQKIKDNENSKIQTLIVTALQSLGGSGNTIFSTADPRQLLDKVDAALENSGWKPFSVLPAKQENKIKKVKAREDSSLSDLTGSILSGEKDCLAPAYFYRGLFFMVLEEFQSALYNFEEAINCNFSGKDEYKLHHKIAQCYLKVKKYKKSREHLTIGIEKIKKAKLSEKQKKDYCKILQESLEKIAKKTDKQDDSLNLIINPHIKDKRLSSLVGIKYTETQGRFCVAQKTIPTGTVIFQDEGITPFLNPDDKETQSDFCLFCMKPIENNPFPCYTCNSVVYCSPKCRVQSEESFHKYTCTIGISRIRKLDRKDWFKIFSSLNVILSKPVSYWIQNKEELLKQNNTDSCDEPTCVENEKDRIQHLFNMVTHEEEISQSTRAKHAIITVFLLSCIRRSNYFGSSGSKQKPQKLTDTELDVGELIYRLRLISEANCYPLWSVDVDDSGQVGLENIGSGIYPSIGSYLNSNCNPNTLRCNVGSSVIIVAAVDIKEGEEICDNYCIHFAELPTAERQGWLEENFFFRCRCTACSSGWSTYDDLPCEVSADLQKTLIPIEKQNQAALRRGDTETALKLHELEIKLLEKHLIIPHQLFVSLRNSYQCCWWTKIANLLKTS